MTAPIAEHEQLIAGLFALARDGRTADELAAVILASGHTDRAEASMVATRIHEIHRINTENAARSQALIAEALDGYPANSWPTPVIVDAAPFADRPSRWTRDETPNPIDAAAAMLVKLGLTDTVTTNEALAGVRAFSEGLSR